ncbi:helix-turn-helix domain-containing protein [Streptomyces nigrescens]
MGDYGNDPRHAARVRLGCKLRELVCASGLSAADAATACGISKSTLQRWLTGESSPGASSGQTRLFWSVIEELSRLCDHLPYGNAAWAALLQAAQREGAEWRGRDQRHRSNLHDSDKPFVRRHHPFPQSATVLTGRQVERAVMASFLRETGSQASSYLCWCAASPAGKTSLLTDFVDNPPSYADVLNFRVAQRHQTDTRAEFAQAVSDQIWAFLHPVKPVAVEPRTSQDWAALLEQAAEKSRARGRTLALVIDGLDSDLAWSGALYNGNLPDLSGSFRDTGPNGDSIAALLPASPHPNLKIIASVRCSDRFPRDLPADHPLRLRECLRTLTICTPAQTAMDQEINARVEQLCASDLGRAILDFVAAAGKGLRIEDLSQLTGAQKEHVEQILHGPDGRCIFEEEPVSGTYALHHSTILKSGLGQLDSAQAAYLARRLHSWAASWRAAEWPVATPPYLLDGYLRLLETSQQRADYVLNVHRQARLAAVAGHDAVLAQLDMLQAETDSDDTTPESLALQVQIAAQRAEALRQARQVPAQAPILFAQLGVVRRARRLARLARNPVVKAARLTELAVHLLSMEDQAATGTPMASIDTPKALAHEATTHVARAARAFPHQAEEAAAYTDLARSALSLLRISANATSAPTTVTGTEPPDAAAALLGIANSARSLLQAAIRSEATDVDTAVAVAHGLAANPAAHGGPDWVTALRHRADDLSVGSPQAQAAALHIWAALDRAQSSHHAEAGHCSCPRCQILTLCDAMVDESQGLLTVDILALAASAMPERPKEMKRKALRLLLTGIERLAAALDAPEALSPADQAHLRREVATTLQRLTQATDDTGSGEHAFDGIKSLLTALPEALRIGVLGDHLAERAQTTISIAEPAKISEAIRRHETHLRRQGQRKTAPPKNGTTQDAPHIPTPAASPDTTPFQHSTPGHDPEASPLPEHISLLMQAEQLLHKGNHRVAHERIEAALRSAPQLTPSTSGNDWTVPLIQALGTTAEYTEAEALITALPPEHHALHLTALSLGCAQGGHAPEAARYSHAAAHLVEGVPDPGLRAYVAQALAHAGHPQEAIAMAHRTEPGDPTIGRNASRTRHTLTLIAAGLVGHQPDLAAQLAGQVTQSLKQRIECGSPLPLLPQLAELLLAYPDIRRPAPLLSTTIQLAVHHATRAPHQQWRGDNMLIMALLGTLNCDLELPPAELIDDWLNAAPHAPGSPSELAVLRAIQNRVDEALSLAHTTPAPPARAFGLTAIANQLLNHPVLLSPAPSAPDAMTRRCLALAHTMADKAPKDEPQARALVTASLTDEGWTHSIPLLPLLAPTALLPLSTLARVSV